MPRSIEPLHTRRAAQLKALVQARNTLPPGDRYAIIALANDCSGAAGFNTSHLPSGSLELIDTLAGRYLQEVTS
jgi:hypothetical protein